MPKSADMRWRFPDDTDVAEAEERRKILERIDEWWQAFAESSVKLEGAFAGRFEFDIAEFMQQHLQRIDSKLMWEFGPALRSNGHRLVITPESERQLRPLVETVLARAPSIPGWEFYPYRQADNHELALANAKGRSGVDVSNFTVQAKRGALNAIDLVWVLANGLAPSEDLHGAAFVATESLLGEEILDTWIGDISIEPHPRPSFLARMMGRGGAPSSSDGAEQPASLRERVTSLISSVCADLPKEPYATTEDNSNGTLFELEPSQAEDYPRQLDLMVSGSRGLPQMWRAAHLSLPFSSRRFSNHGEAFCYLKVDGIGGLAGSAYTDRSQLEDAIDDTLRPHALGSVIGGGTGLRYSYVDLALRLEGIDRSIVALRTLAREGKIPKRSWLLFFDAQWQDEWIGIYDETPPPP